MFLRGYGTPEWLNAIGAYYSIDLEFFLRHLDLFLKSTSTDYFAYPALPSSSGNMLRFCITTLGHRVGNSGQGYVREQRSVDALRRRADQGMHEHIDAISRRSADDVKLSDSMVRKFSVHDLSTSRLSRIYRCM